MKASTRTFIFGISGLLLVCLLGIQWGATHTTDPVILYQLRLPRVILGCAVGMGLAVSGAVLQTLFSNPLCEPYVLGISSGSALGAVVGTFLGFNLPFMGLVFPAFLGALVFGGFLHLLASFGKIKNQTLLLCGVMLGLLGSSLVSLWMAISDPNGIQGVIFWLLGDLSRAELGSSILIFVITLVAIILLLGMHKSLDGLLTGEEAAIGLGVSVGKIRRNILLITSLLVGLAVSSSGMIGFVGLLVPNVVRRHGGSLHGVVIPLSAVWGAVILVLADLVARVLLRPTELPVGVVTALLGAPFFIFLMLKGRSLRG